MYGLGLSQGLNLERIKIKGKEHALFKTKDGRISMVDAVCPHRGAKLCNGKVKGNNIQCPYHGWEFDPDGTLVKVPSSGNIPCKGDIQSYSVVEDGGFIWASDTKDTLPTRYCEELFDPSWVKVYGSRELQGNIYDWILNATDISHINFVHDFADEDNARVRNTKVEMKR
jgi:phenylpropionate dioxygenase-like ring-hydroxylating dioxygenase large terminal subunit